MFALSSAVEVDGWGDTLLRTLQAQGLPDVVTVVSPDAAMDPKARSGILKSLLSFIQYFVPNQSRVFDLHTASDRLNALRSLSEGKPGDVRWRDGRTWMLGESTEWEEGSLRVTGVVRGTSLSANRLVHISNFGDYQIEKVHQSFVSSISIINRVVQIMSCPIPRPFRATTAQGMDVEPTILAEPDPSSADSLVSSNDPDDLANEQTWPTEEEMNDGPDSIQPRIPDAEKGTTPKAVRRIPKGMSEYQAAWIIDETDEEDVEEDAEGREVNGEGEMDEDSEREEMVDMPMDEEMDIDSRKSVVFQDLDNEEEEKQ